jgi:cytochrome d ubiquinol oxidase subunit II
MIVAIMVAAYVVLDGFDLGAGAIYLISARSPQERQSIMRAIGPYWDGNEVWLLAAGGTLYFAFPLLYASSFSGFYLPLMMVLWLLMLRGIGIELRGHSDNPVWHGFFDVVFCLSSILLCVFFGAALGNVVRGVPLGTDHYFFEPLWTNFRVGADNGILDWYTVLTGVIALVTLTTHGSLFVATKTEGEVNRRACAVAKIAWPIQLLLTIVGLIATVSIRRRTRKLQASCHWIRNSRAGLWRSCGDVVRDAQRRGSGLRKDRVRRFRALHRGDVGRGGFRALSRRAAGQHRSIAEPDDLQHQSWRSRP